MSMRDCNLIEFALDRTFATEEEQAIPTLERVAVYVYGSTAEKCIEVARARLGLGSHWDVVRVEMTR